MDNSRLSKLLELLAASSSVLRDQATIQIAEIVGAHSAEAGPLLLKVRRFLRDNSWDARYAAAKTVGEVSAICFENKNGDYPSNGKDGSTWTINFDLNSIIASGFVLVSSEGKEYEKGENEIDARSQKLRLKEQLGVPSILEAGVEDFVSEEDFKISLVKSTANDNLNPPTVKMIKFEEDDDPTTLENELNNCKSADGNQKLWWFYRLLCHDLYNPIWTIRHGAALGLKEIQKHLCRSFLYLPKIFSSARHPFFVLAVDRFDDFMGNHAVGPVRECCAQVLGSLFPLLPKQGKETLMKILIQFVSSPVTKPWQCVHAGLLMLKYSLPFVLPLSSAHPGTINSLLRSLCICVQFQNEEVIIAASEAIAPNIQLINCSVDGAVVEELLSIVWNLLLTSRFDINDDWVRGLVHIAAELGAIYPRPYKSEHISVLSLFLDHPSIEVCERAVKCLTTAIENPVLKLSEQGMLHILRMIFFRTLTSRDKTLNYSIEKLWLCLLDNRSGSCDVVLPACPFFGQWLTCLITNENYPSVDPGLLGFVDRQIFIGGEDVMALNEIDRFAAVVAAKLNTARLLAHLAIRLSKVKTTDGDCESPLSSLENCLTFHLNSSSIVRKSVVCMLLVEWAKINHHDILSANCAKFPFGFCNIVRENLMNSSILFEELMQKLTEINSLYNDIIRHFNGERQIKNSTFNFNTISGLREAAEFCRNLIEEDKKQNKNAPIFKEFNCKVSEVQQQMSRLLCWLSCLSVRFFELPEKLNPIIIPLMDVIKMERIPSIVDEASECLAALLIRTVPRQPSPSCKIFKNLICIHCSDDSKTPPFRLDDENFCNKCQMFNSDKRLFIADGDSLRKKTSCLENLCSFTDKSLAASNAGLVLRKVCSLSGARLPDMGINLWSMLNDDLPNEECQELVSSLQVLETVFSSLSTDQRQIIMDSSKRKFLKFIQSENCSVRNMIGRCLVTFANADLLFVINGFLQTLLSYLNDPDNETARIGSMEVIFNLVEEAKINVIGVASIIALPVLARMSDSNVCVRQMASQTFGSLVKLLPLEINTEMVGLSTEIKSMLHEQRQFLQLLARPEELGRVDLPISETKAVLRPYQKDGVNWLLFLNKFNLHGILCDDMGLGKTLQTLCCLAFSVKNNICSSPAASIIVCPKTLVQHWVGETGKFFDKSILRATSVDNSVGLDESWFDKFNVFVVSYDYLRRENKLIYSRKWNYCILDEGHIIKNPKTLTAKAVTQLKCEHRLVLSGTPIQNNVLELWSLFEFLIPGYLGDRKQFQQRFGKPILGAREAKASSNEMRAGQAALDSLHKMVLPFILRRRKADVLDDLPPKIVQDYYCVLSPLQKKLYQDFSQMILDQFNEESSASQRNAFQILTYLRKLCDHPCLVLKPDHVEYSEISENLKENYGCENLDDISLSGKCVALRQLLLECGIGGQIGDEDEDRSAGVSTAVSTHRALIFCQFKSVVDLIADYFSRNIFGSLSYLRLDGTIPPSERQSVADKFNGDPSIDVLLLTTHIGGLGLNLTGADVVIFVDHDWNPAKDLQAMDRAHRIGQKRTVNVYRLISQGSLEEKIMRLQIFKSQNADAVIGEQNRSLASMATEQLLDLLTVDNNGPASASATNSQKMKNKNSKKSSPNAEQLSLDLPALWDQSQYEDAFDFNKFLKSMQR